MLGALSGDDLRSGSPVLKCGVVFLGSSVGRLLGRPIDLSSTGANRWGVINGLCSSLLMAPEPVALAGARGHTAVP